MRRRIILFDDIPEQREEILRALEREVGARGEVRAFVAGAAGIAGGTHESRLVADLSSTQNADASLIVADRDLTGYTEQYTGLSESQVRLVTSELGIPECAYARGEDADDYVERAEQEEACIRLSLKPDLASFAKRVAAVAEGFAEISNKLSARGQDPGKRSLGSELAEILGKPGCADKISLFASGDQNRLASMERARKAGTQVDKKRRLACFLGYWLWDSVLRFPGVVVNEVAASSYLNIHETEFKGDVEALFSAARYRGPFAAAKDPLWWRDVLTDIYGEDDCPDGRSYAEKKLGRIVQRSECCEDPSKNAGYYCFLRRRPVSLELSKPGLPWFPRGADLARVSQSAYEELGPWV